MAWVFRAGVSKLRTSTGLYKLTSTNNVPKIQVAWISTREVRKDRPPRPAPFPYKEKRFGIWSQLFDDTVFRFDDNTKIIVVDGPPAVGKGDVCRNLAQELDMLYVPQSVMEDHYLHEYDFDLRSLNDKLPESCWTIDLETVFKNPSLRNVAVAGFLFYQLRFQKFIQILAHVLSTGQGVVTERSPWSDMCFAKALHDNGLMSPNAFKSFNIMIDQSLHELMRPHLIVYLDVPVRGVQQKIKERNIPGESKLLSEKFLTDLEKNYKFDYLKQMNEHAHILIYDYSDGGDFEVIVEDIETLNFEEDTKKFSDWDLQANVMWTMRRRKYCEEELDLLIYLAVEQMIATELIVSADDMAKRYEVLKEFAPRQVWDSTYMPFKGFEKKMLSIVQ